MNGSIERIKSALQFIPVGGHDERVRVAMMIKSELGDAGREVWDEWRSGRGHDEAASVWRSIDPDGLLKIGTLYHEAKANGWPDDGHYRKPTAEELVERNRLSLERAKQAQAEQEATKAKTANTAATIWKAATPAKEDLTYLVRKRVKPVATLREIEAGTLPQLLGYVPKSNGEALTGRVLVVPVKQNGMLSTLELIDGDGRKAALAGPGTKAGGFWASGPLPDGNGKGLVLVIGEGVATVLSAHEATSHPVMAALSSGNLAKVAKSMRESYPLAELIILADLIKATGEPDPHAIEAGQAVGGKVAVPVFGPDREPGQTDFNDMAKVFGLELVAEAIRNAKAPAPKLEHVDVNLICGRDISPTPIAWLWQGWLAAGKMHILGGAPGTGKTTIMMSLAATITTGARWPDGTLAPFGNVVIWSGEDDPGDTLIPRLCLSGADLSRVFFIDDIREGTEKRAFDPARDMEPLRRKLEGVGNIRLLIIDPIVSAVTGDSHKNAEVRRALQPLVDLAASMKCALLGITHFSKGTGGRDPVERLTGSLAFGALARVVLVAAKQQDEAEDGRTVRLFCRAKSNIGPDDGGFEYDLHQAELPHYPGVFSSCVLWGQAIEGEARELLASADSSSDSEGGLLADAKLFLSDLLSNGPVPTKAIKADADGAGYSWSTIRRAQSALRIKPRKEGQKGGWV